MSALTSDVPSAVTAKFDALQLDSGDEDESFEVKVPDFHFDWGVVTETKQANSTQINNYSSIPSIPSKGARNGSSNYGSLNNLGRNTLRETSKSPPPNTQMAGSYAKHQLRTPPVHQGSPAYSSASSQHIMGLTDASTVSGSSLVPTPPASDLLPVGRMGSRLGIGSGYPGGSGGGGTSLTRPRQFQRVVSAPVARRSDIEEPSVDDFDESRASTSTFRNTATLRAHIAPPALPASADAPSTSTTYTTPALSQRVLGSSVGASTSRRVGGLSRFGGPARRVMAALDEPEVQEESSSSPAVSASAVMTGMRSVSMQEVRNMPSASAVTREDRDREWRDERNAREERDERGLRTSPYERSSNRQPEPANQRSSQQYTSSQLASEAYGERERLPRSESRSPPYSPPERPSPRHQDGGLVPYEKYNKYQAQDRQDKHDRYDRSGDQENRPLGPAPIHGRDNQHPAPQPAYSSQSSYHAHSIQSTHSQAASTSYPHRQPNPLPLQPVHSYSRSTDVVNGRSSAEGAEGGYEKRSARGISPIALKAAEILVPSRAAPRPQIPSQASIQAQQRSQPQQPPQPPAQAAVTEPAVPVAPPVAIQPAPAQGKRSFIVNSTPYERIGTLGRGGSSKVYSVLCHNTRLIYALKRVALDRADAETYQSYTNEIELLKRLRGHDRIIRLIDHQITFGPGNRPKILMMVMECGEIDFASLLDDQRGRALNMSFVGLYWQQMLEAVHAVHLENVVHTDLKPANFVLVKGRLKIIDFGIAKAVANDTVNIQRDQQRFWANPDAVALEYGMADANGQIGTVNYMSPEAIQRMNNQKVLKLFLEADHQLSYPSDVWSLGCILYQMIYGNPPFAHIGGGPLPKMNTIANPSHTVDYPSRTKPPLPTSGNAATEADDPSNPEATGTLVPLAAIDVMRRCLMYRKEQRLTIPELLAHEFLRPAFASSQPALPPGSTTITQSQMTMLVNFILKSNNLKLLGPHDETATDLFNDLTSQNNATSNLQ